MENKKYRALKIFKVLSNVTRYKIIELLYKDSYKVNEIANILKKPETTISRNLKILRDLDIVSYYTKDTSVIYSLKKIELIEVIKKIEEMSERK
jgi:ArsR family transcriptional regulator